MNSYTTGTMIRRLREEKNLTQADLAEKLFVSDKAISKWETGKGYPDITLIEPLAAAHLKRGDKVEMGGCVYFFN